MGCVQYVIGKNNFLVKYEGGQKREMSSGLILYVCSKDEVVQEIDKPIYGLTQK